MTTSSSNYKKTVKILRKLNPSLSYGNLRPRHENIYKHLLEVEDEKIQTKEIIREKKSIEFNDLPEDTIFMILEFLPHNTRIAILKNKYNKAFIKNVIKNSVSLEELTKIWKCAKLAESLLLEMNLLNKNGNQKGNVYRNLNTVTLSCYKSEQKQIMYSNWYKESFSKIILAALKHYIKIYKSKLKIIKILDEDEDGVKMITFKYYQSYTQKTIQNVEQIMMQMFAQLVEIK